MEKKPVNSLYEGVPEEIDDLQLTEEEIGMVYSGAKAAGYVCSYCGAAFPVETTLKRHIAVCPKNPNKKVSG